MPVLPNAKQEKFCQLRLAGKSQRDAYRLAGYKPSDTAAARLCRNVQVKARLQELHIEAMAKVEVTVESMAAQFDEDRALAIKNKQISAAHSASVSKAKLYGLMTEKQQIAVTHSYATMSDEEIAFEFAALLADARAQKPGVH
jgi:phage terminase small subunit